MTAYTSWKLERKRRKRKKSAKYSVRQIGQLVCRENEPGYTLQPTWMILADLCPSHVILYLRQLLQFPVIHARHYHLHVILYLRQLLPFRKKIKILVSFQSHPTNYFISFYRINSERDKRVKKS